MHAHEAVCVFYLMLTETTTVVLAVVPTGAEEPQDKESWGGGSRSEIRD